MILDATNVKSNVSSKESASTSRDSTLFPPGVRQHEAGKMEKPLGTLTKFVESQFTSIDDKTGEIQQLKHVSKRNNEDSLVVVFDQDSSDLERWILKGAARRLLLVVEDRIKRRRCPYSEFAFYSEIDSRKVKTVLVCERYVLEPCYIKINGVWEVQFKRAAKFRVVNCCRDKIGRYVAPEIWLSSVSNRASFHKVAVCGSVWTCPLCSRRINLMRQAHIKAAYDLFVNHEADILNGDYKGDAMMITFTVKHGIGDDLGELLEKLKSADRIMQRSHAYKRFIGYKMVSSGVRVPVRSTLDYVGRISATEVTHGSNGWHPHSHQLWFFDRRLTVKEIHNLRHVLFLEWAKACESVGLPTPKEFIQGNDGKRHYVGVDVRRALSAEEYLTKFGSDRTWSPEKELASQHTKAGKKGKSAFQLLFDYAQGDKLSGALFAQFAGATLGRHQIEFSKGLRSRLVDLGLKEVLATDEELALELEGDTKIGELTDDDFEALCGADKFGIEAFGTLLLMCKLHGFDVAVDWLRSLPSYPMDLKKGFITELS